MPRTLLLQLGTILLCLFSQHLSADVVTEKDKPFVLQLKWFHQFQFAGYYAALDKGFYKEENLEVIIRERDIKSSPVDDVLNGTADFGISDSSLIRRKLDGDPIVALAVIFQVSPLIIMSLEEEGIRSPLDLIGKRVMYQRDVDDALIMAVLNEVNVQESDFTYIPHNFNNDALLTKDVDAMSAYITDQPFYYRKMGHTINILNPSNYGIDFYGDNLFTSEKLMISETEKVMAFRRASIKGWEYAIENSEEVIGWIIEKYNVDPGKLEALRYEADMTRRMIKPRLVEIGNINISRFSRIADIYKEKEMAPSSASLQGLYYEDYIQKRFNFNVIVKAAIGISAALFIIAFIMVILNRRLNAAVTVRTQELAIANKDVEKTNLRLKEMVGFVSHDLRNPLSNIISMARMLKSGRITENRMPMAIETINDSAEKALELVQAILEAAALGTGKYQLNKQPMDLPRFLEDCIINHKGLADTREVTIELNCDSVVVLADKHRISQVLDNILLNAVKYSLNNSSILISTAISDKRVTIRCINKIGSSEVLTGDESILFKSFGFGLEIIREILELHGSSLSLTTKNDEYVAEFSLDIESKK